MRAERASPPTALPMADSEEWPKLPSVLHDPFGFAGALWRRAKTSYMYLYVVAAFVALPLALRDYWRSGEISGPLIKSAAVVLLLGLVLLYEGRSKDSAK